MARIPMGQFEQATALPQLQRSRVDLPDPRTAGAGSAALANAFGDVANMAARMRAQEQAESQALARAKAQNAVLDDEIAQRGIVDDITQRVADGSLRYDKAQEELQTRLSVREAEDIPDLDPVGRENYQRALQRNKFGTTTTIDGVVKAARRADFKGQIAGMRDRLGKFASDPNADLDRLVRGGAELRALAEQAGIAGTFDKEQQDFSDRVYTDNAKARLVAGRDSLDSLNALERDLTAEGGRYYGKLDADKVNTLLSQVQVRRAQLEAKADTAAKKGESAAERVLGAFERQIASTIPAPDDTMVQWSETVKLGTPEQRERWNELIKDEIEVRQVLTMPPDQQRAYVQQREAEQVANGATVQQQANLSRMKAVVERNAKDMREQPLVVHERLTGETVPDLDVQALVSGDTQAVKGQIAARLDTLSAMRRRFGPEVGNAVLKPQEAAMLSSVLDKASPAQAAQFFGTLSGIFDDRDAYRAAMQQIAPDSPVRAYAGMVFAEQRETTVQKGGIFRGAVKAQAGDVARLLLEGEALLNKSKGDKAADGKGGTFPMPSPEAMRTELAGFVGDAFRKMPENYEVAQQAVRAYYAAAASREGDVSGELDVRRLEEAARAVLGEPVNVNGVDVLPPWGMEEADFTDALAAHWAPIAATIPAGKSRDFDDYTLSPAGNDRYYVLTADGRMLGDRQGNPVQIDVRAPLAKAATAKPTGALDTISTGGFGAF